MYSRCNNSAKYDHRKINFCCTVMAAIELSRIAKMWKVLFHIALKIGKCIFLLPTSSDVLFERQLLYSFTAQARSSSPHSECSKISAPEARPQGNLGYVKPSSLVQWNVSPSRGCLPKAGGLSIPVAPQAPRNAGRFLIIRDHRAPQAATDGTLSIRLGPFRPAG